MKGQDLVEAFRSISTKLPDELVQSCTELAHKLHLATSSAHVLTDEWEAFSLKKGGDLRMTPENFAEFSKSPGILQLLRQTGAATNINDMGEKTGYVTPSPKKRLREGSSKNLKIASPLEATKHLPISTSPSRSLDSLIKVRSVAGIKYKDRKEAGMIIAAYQDLSIAQLSNQTNVRSSTRCIISDSKFVKTNVSKPYRFGFVPLEKKAAALDNHLMDLQDSMLSLLSHEIKDELVESVGVPCQETVICFGRICTDAHEGKINPSSILLEGSRHLSSGKRVQLDISKLDTPYSLFPGQIVCVEGVNLSGRKLMASKIHDGVALPKLTSSADALLQLQHVGMEGRPTSVIVAAGPFTTSDNLDYEPLQDLLSHLLLDAPDVVILTGPFVDLLHPNVAQGDMSLPLEDGSSMAVTPEVLFANRVAGLLEQLYEDYYHNSADGRELETQFVLVPSLDDIIVQGGAVYPQPPLMDCINFNKSTTPTILDGLEIGTLGLHHVETAGRKDGSSKKRIHCVSNPCTFQINDVVFGITSTDVIQHICSDETNARLSEKRLLRVAKHLIKQACFYPLFPPSIALDYTHRVETLMPYTPDVLIVPSKLNVFVEPVECNNSNCLVINPGWLTKGTTGGTYATMTIYPMKRDTLEQMDSDVLLDHNVHLRTKVEIKRI